MLVTGKQVGSCDNLRKRRGGGIFGSVKSALVFTFLKKFFDCRTSRMHKHL